MHNSCWQCWSIASNITSRSCATAVGVTTTWLIVISNGRMLKVWEKRHLACVCRSKTLSKKEPHPQHKSNPCLATILTKSLRDYSMYNITSSPVQPLKVMVIVNSTNLEMEVDTGLSSSSISIYNQFWPQDWRSLVFCTVADCTITISITLEWAHYQKHLTHKRPGIVNIIQSHGWSGHFHGSMGTADGEGWCNWHCLHCFIYLWFKVSINVRLPESTG